MKYANYFLNRLFAECCFLFKRLFLLFTQLTYNSIYGDYYLDSEMMIGLCPVSNTAQVQNVLHKIFNYKPITLAWENNMLNVSGNNKSGKLSFINNLLRTIPCKKGNGSLIFLILLNYEKHSICIIDFIRY
jgi:hypothetical protein